MLSVRVVEAISAKQMRRTEVRWFEVMFAFLFSVMPATGGGAVRVAQGSKRRSAGRLHAPHSAMWRISRFPSPLRTAAKPRSVCFFLARARPACDTSVMRRVGASILLFSWLAQAAVWACPAVCDRKCESTPGPVDPAGCCASADDEETVGCCCRGEQGAAASAPRNAPRRHDSTCRYDSSCNPCTCPLANERPQQAVPSRREGEVKADLARLAIVGGLTAAIVVSPLGISLRHALLIPPAHGPPRALLCIWLK